MNSAVMLLIVLAAAGGLFWAALVVSYARTLLAPPRMTNAKAWSRLQRMSPADLGMPFKDIPLQGADGLRLTGWWIPAEGSRRTAILLHAFGDAKVGALAWAPIFRDLGCHLFLLDLRAHGESAGEYHTAGHREAEDLHRVIEQLKALFPSAAESIVLFGASFGGAVASRYASLAPDPAVKAMVLDSPVPSFESGAIAHAAQFALPGPWVAWPALRLAQAKIGHPLAEVATSRTLRASKLPALVILPLQDAYVDAAGRDQLRAPNAQVWEPNCTHLLAVNAAPAEYRARVHALLDRSGPTIASGALQPPLKLLADLQG